MIQYLCGEIMKTIKNNIENTLIIKNSKFITNIFKLNNNEDINIYIKEIKEKYYDANHNCYAYIYENTKKCSDDGEPSSTAGMPMLQVLEKKGLTNVLVIVTRYFGGIKLGASGLVRAYSNSVSSALDNVEIINLIKGKNITLIFNYDNVKKIDYLLKDKTILNKEFKDKIKYNLNVDDSLFCLLKENKEIEIIIEKNDIYI